MFKTREDYVWAMLDGRKFTDGLLCEWNGKTFTRGGLPYSIFNSYVSVTEILPEPEPFEPKEGEEIYVANRQDCEWKRRNFIGMFNEFFMCKNLDERNLSPSPWFLAKPIPEENPWITNNGETFPDYNLSDVIEYRMKDDSIGCGTAGSLRWSSGKGSAGIVESRIKK